MKRLLSKFASLPRSMKWMVAFVAALALYFGVIEPLLDATSRLNASADSLAAGLTQERDLLSPESQKGRLLSDGRRFFGEPLLPGDPGSRPELAHAAIDGILEKHGVAKRQKNERRVPFRGDELTTLLGSAAAQKSAERMILDLIFEASPENATAIVQELEQAKEIALISKVDLRRPDAGRDAKSGAAASSGKILKVTITLEAWIVSSASGTGGTI